MMNGRELLIVFNFAWCFLFSGWASKQSARTNWKRPELLRWFHKTVKEHTKYFESIRRDIITKTSDLHHPFPTFWIVQHCWTECSKSSDNSEPINLLNERLADWLPNRTGLMAAHFNRYNCIQQNSTKFCLPHRVLVEFSWSSRGVLNRSDFARHRITYGHIRRLALWTLATNNPAGIKTLN